MLTLWVESEFTRAMVNKPAHPQAVAQAASARLGGQMRVTGDGGPGTAGGAPLRRPRRPPDHDKLGRPAGLWAAV